MKKYISISEYAKRYNLSRSQVRAMIDNNELEYVVSPGGGKFHIAVDEVKVVNLEEVNLKLDMLLRHLGVQ